MTADFLRRLAPSAVLAATVLGVSAGPVRVFVLTGQSNMEGKGTIRHLEELIADPSTAKEFGHLRDGDRWVERDDVWIKYFDRKGPLTVGYATPANRIGPELGFGHVVGEALDEPVVIIKAAWGGRSLAVNFRPPSSGTGTFTRRDKKTKERVPLPDEAYGDAYRALVEEVRTALADLEDHYPGYPGDGFELSGLVFFQGFNDVINAEFTAEYGEHLANLVRDLRKDLGVPGLPVVIGELGQQGDPPEPRYAEKHLRFRGIQESVAKLPEFEGTVRYVPTSIHVVKESKGDGGYHYYGRADTFYRIGVDFGKAILPLLGDTPVDHSAQVEAAAK